MAGTTPGHSLTVRATHWLNALAMACMVMSGWGIYDANPFWPVYFPRWATLGGWLGGSLAWHFAMMWLLAINGLVYIVNGLVTGHFRRDVVPPRARLVWQDLWSALLLRLDHRKPGYNAVQRLAYAVALLLGIVLVVSGVCLWKPVQFQLLSNLLGGYEATRRIHFLAMSGLVGFIVLHLALVAAVPRTLPGMITGSARSVR